MEQVWELVCLPSYSNIKVSKYPILGICPVMFFVTITWALISFAHWRSEILTSPDFRCFKKSKHGRIVLFAIWFDYKLNLNSATLQWIDKGKIKSAFETNQTNYWQTKDNKCLIQTSLEFQFRFILGDLKSTLKTAKRYRFNNTYIFKSL